jgi:hypothetical protein
MPPLSLGSSGDNACCETALSNPFGFGGMNAVVRIMNLGQQANIAYSGEPIALLSLFILIQGGDIPCLVI